MSSPSSRSCEPREKGARSSPAQFVSRPWRLGGGSRVPNRVPESADPSSPYSTESDEASLNAIQDERQRANHNPRVGGSSPSSGITKTPQTQGFLFGNQTPEPQLCPNSVPRSAHAGPDEPRLFVHGHGQPGAGRGGTPPELCSISCPLAGLRFQGAGPAMSRRRGARCSRARRWALLVRISDLSRVKRRSNPAMSSRRLAG